MFPKLIAFDLDYTLWDLWIDTHVTGPLRQAGDGVVDAYGVPVEFYSDVPGILRRLRDQGVFIAACSRTHAPDMARQALKLLRVAGNDDEPPQPAIELFDNLQIYPGSKLTHFREIHAKTGIPYSQMLFFDDERRNREVENLGKFIATADPTELLKFWSKGVVFHLTPTGVDNATFDAGIRAWQISLVLISSALII
ncbi:Magnesium-dependent phosphatase-1 [Mycena sanguinolenta]|uniref:Magnesium-dependent phosphatase-1 n=1 Tax=Mycena sanguinolenta TaxID=230812 RepID=A0A8H6XP04_9AGAR|nr:Magnesium-dependent phosphatase-1 [Mycena sanguinolenta]